MFIAVALSPSLDLRGVIVAAMVCVWALRLGSFLFMRVKKAGFDRRFTVMKTMFVRFLLTWTLGGTWVFITFSAGLTAITSEKHTDADFFLFLGGLLWLAGFSIEVIADKQKTVFRANTENAGKFIRTGLWSISRHPNYFGEMMLWLGIAVIALPTLVGWQFATLISPIFVILLISKVSGVNLLEANANERWGSDSEYQKYVASTPVIVPFLGRRTHHT
jgi:steroid 5-alpha reductase family enzyme